MPKSTLSILLLRFVNCARSQQSCIFTYTPARLRKSFDEVLAQLSHAVALRRRRIVRALVPSLKSKLVRVDIFTKQMMR